ncbi:RNA polymerase II subunit A C-terminal domain phosphatase-like [Saccostrea echinata]|uniref:RNA polymerase II subunit A C-terminal domain phosphatase-like n=1 Tax=Saccostrea echinata TaxID=191078 RepID=UPI002A83C0F6|nr:RNA polymerase II subunit A C-terminal domain phosphatase-like [Saccostrea echinata]
MESVEGGTISWIKPTENKLIKVTKWRVKLGSKVGKGALLCLYETEDTKNLKLKSNMVGTVLEMKQEFIPGSEGLVKMESCTHPTVMKDMCADCGADLRQEAGIAGNRKEPVSASVAMVHNIPELIVSEKQAMELGKMDEERLLRTRKLVLLVDLDQTLIHTTNDNIPPNLKGVYHFQLSHGNMMPWYHTRIRPMADRFLENISKLYELHICTFGSRMYAHIIAKFLDPDGKYFSHRILSRDECFNQNSKMANLKALFPCGDSMVCIIDDREDVWNYSPNLIHVKPYRFFQGTADINAPPGLDKKEHDKEPLTHKVHIISRSNSKEDNNEKKEGMGGETEEKGGGKSGQTENGEAAKTDAEETDRKCEKDNEKKSSDVNRKEESKDVESAEETNKDCGKETNSVKNKEESMECERTVQSNSEATKAVTCNTEKSDIEKNGKGKETKEKEEDREKEEDGKTEDVEIEWDDDDDYLLYLEEILTTVHKAFYDMYDQLKLKGENAEKPDMKNILPYVKRKVLKGRNILFSGVFPMSVPLEKSRAYHVAKMLGANVHTDFIPRAKDGSNKSDYTTHVVAARLGTVKVKMAQKHKYVKLVNPQWLWACAERMQHVDERLYPLNDSTSGNAYCESPDPSRLNRKRKNEEESDSGKRPRKHDDGDKIPPQEEMEASEKVEKDEEEDDMKVKSAARITSARFSTSYNPMLAFSDEDLECMDKEVEDLMDEEGDESEEDDIDRNERIRLSVLSSGDDDNSSSGESMSGDLPRGWNLKKRHRSSKSGDSSSDNEENEKHRDEESENELEKYEKTVAAFAPDTESETQDSFAESVGSVDDEMAEAIEREFLAN